MPADELLFLTNAQEPIAGEAELAQVRQRIGAALVALAWYAAAPAAAQEASQEPEAAIGARDSPFAASAATIAPVADHHMHILSAATVAWMRRMAEKMPEAVKGMSEDIYKVRDGAEALRELDRAGIRQGVLLSAGYMFASPMFPAEGAEMARQTREENRNTVEAARASGGRLVAMVGINPFANNAYEELAYWSRQDGVSGIKLHMGNSGLDLKSPQQVAKLASFFGMARVARMPIVVHLRGMAPFDGAGVQLFIDKVLLQAGDLPVQIAHGGGYGGVDQPTLDAIAAYRDAIARKAPGTQNLVIELSAVAQYDLTGGKDPAVRAERLVQYVAEMRKIGMDRFVFGSDWPALNPPKEYFADEKKQLPISDAEWAQIASNRAPYLLPSWSR